METTLVRFADLTSAEQDAVKHLTEEFHFINSEINKIEESLEQQQLDIAELIKTLEAKIAAVDSVRKEEAELMEQIKTRLGADSVKFSMD